MTDPERAAAYLASETSVPRDHAIAALVAHFQAIRQEERENAKAQIHAALAEGERQGRERGKRDGILMALERVENAARYYDGERARLLEVLIAELRSLVDQHPAEERGGTGW